MREADRGLDSPPQALAPEGTGEGRGGDEGRGGQIDWSPLMQMMVQIIFHSSRHNWEGWQALPCVRACVLSLCGVSGWSCVEEVMVSSPSSPTLDETDDAAPDPTYRGKRQRVC